jgi:cytochrome b
VWDLPVRLFHWLLAGSFVGAFAIANLMDDESSLFALHMLLGGVMAFMVLLRVIWGFVGSRYARFGSFTFGPRALLAYLRGAVSGKGERHTGHNPGSSFAVYAMLGLALGLAVTGAGMSRGGKAFEELHEVLAWAMVAVVGAHVAGIVWHTVRHKDNIALSMVDGHKRGDPAQGIGSSHALVALAFLGLTGLWAGALYSGYDARSSQVTLPLVGKTIQLGEGEKGEKHGKSGDHGRDHDRDD